MSGSKTRGVTMVEILVAAGLLGFVMTAVLSFYSQAIAVSAKRDQQSVRLRRFHLTLDKIERVLSVARIRQATTKSLTFLKMSEGTVQSGFPLYETSPSQYLVTEDALVYSNQGKSETLLKFDQGETMSFTWVAEDPYSSPPLFKESVLNISITYNSPERSNLFFHRTLLLQRY